MNTISGILGPVNAAAIVRECRAVRGINQAELARRAGTSQTYISRVERGEVSPSVDTLRRIASAAGMRIVGTVEPLDPGNSDPRELHADLNRTTPADRVREAIELSEFLTGLAAGARRGG